MVVLGVLADRASLRGRVLRRVSVGDTDVSGLRPSGVHDVLILDAQRLGVLPVPVRIEGRQLSFDPVGAGAHLDVDATVKAAFAARRRGWWGGQVVSWLQGLAGGRARVEWEVRLDPARFEDVVSSWDRAAGSSGRAAGLRFEGATVEAVYPEPGRRVDRATARSRLVAALRRLPRPVVEMGLAPAFENIPAVEVDRAAGAARQLLAAPVTATAASLTATLTPADLGGVLRAVPAGSKLELTADVPALSALLEARLGPAHHPPRDATWDAQGEKARVVPAEDGQVLEATTTVGPFMNSLSNGSRRVQVATRSVPPARTTAQAEALHIVKVVSSFTTSHPAGQPRVENIHRMADAINGTVVGPSETYSVNARVGARTKEAGYLEAPVIYDAEYKSDIGGGVSQFATTLFNAAYMGGYRIEAATAHAFYISRYPAGRDATLSYPEPDLAFTNDTDAGLLVRTSYSGTEITVTLYGDNGGRVVELVTGEAYDVREPKTVYRPDPEVPPGRTYRQQAGTLGFTIQVTRLLHHPDGRTTTGVRTTVYDPPDEIVLINPADPVPPPEKTAATS